MSAQVDPRVAALAVRQNVEIRVGAATVTIGCQKRSQVYWLRLSTVNERWRWGTASEISEDLAYVESFACLPPVISPRW